MFEQQQTQLNLYEVLGCHLSATSEQIQAEYRARAIDLHPDKQQGAASDALERFQQLQYAKEVLCDAAKRRHYDLYLKMGAGVPLSEWMDNQERIQQTLHWAVFDGAQQKQLLSSAPNAEATAKRPAGSAPIRIVAVNERRARTDSVSSSSASSSQDSFSQQSQYPRQFENIGWTSHHSPTLAAFRAYQI